MATDIFCSLYEKWKQGDYIVYEDDSSAAIWSVTPSAPGQAIVFPRRHVPSLRDIEGTELESLMHAVPAAFEAIRGIYETNPERIVAFYEMIRDNTNLFQGARTCAAKMLAHSDLRKKPVAFNLGANFGIEAGQLEDHMHFHLFPRRTKGLGIVTAMGKLLDAEQNR